MIARISSAITGAVSSSWCRIKRSSSRPYRWNALPPGADTPDSASRRIERAVSTEGRGRHFDVLPRRCRARGMARRRGCIGPRPCARARGSRVRPFSPTAMRPRWSSRDGRRRSGAAAASSCVVFNPLHASIPSARHADPVMLELFNNMFMNIAEQMGLRLQNTAYSVNIKERLDFSCALFERRGRADRKRAAYACAPGLDERIDPYRDRSQSAACAAAMCLC